MRRTPPARLLFAVCLAILFALSFTGPAGAQDDDVEGDAPAAEEESPAAEDESPAEGEVVEGEADPAVEALNAQLREGSEVYSQICSSCHQPGGAGLEGQFPPLINNPHVDDGAYVADVITNGRQGEIVVDGVTYDGVMPAFSTLTDGEVDAVVAFIQNDFVAPPAAGDEAAIGPTGPVAGTELPALTNMGSITAFLLAAAVVAMVLAPRVTSANDRLDVPWLDAWLKTAVIVLGIIFFTVFVPDWALKTSYVGKLDRPFQDFIGVSLWAGGLVAVLWAMWYAHRESRI